MKLMSPLLLLLLVVPLVANAQFSYITNNGTIMIEGYTGSGGVVVIPDTINGLQVTCIDYTAFQENIRVTSVTIPDSVTNLYGPAFQYCVNLTNVTIGSGVTIIYGSAFSGCSRLRSITIPNSVTVIGGDAFYGCHRLTSVTIPKSVIQISSYAFSDCTSLTNVTIVGAPLIWIAAFGDCPALKGVYCRSNAPVAYAVSFVRDTNVTVYYLPGTTGWTNFAQATGVPTVLWLPQMQTTDASFGVQTNQFGFNVNWASGMVVAVDACTNLLNPDWFPLQTNTLTSDSVYFSDSQWTNYPARFYRLRSP